MADRTFDISIILGLVDEASDKFKTIQGRSEMAREGFKKAGAALTAFAVAGSVAIIGLTKKASDLEETASKFNVVFENQIDLAEEWSKELVASYGVSTEQSKRFLGSIQDLLVPMGMQSDIAAKLSNEVVKLSIDLGSFNNMPTERVMLDIQSALVGNFETMKKYGVVLNATRVEQHIMNQKWVESKDQITQAMKAQAAYELIVGGSANALGDFIRTSEGYANQVKIMQAGITDLSAKLGTALLPTMKEIVKIINTATKVLQSVSPEVITLTAKFLLMSTAIAGILGPIGLLIGFFPQMILGVKQIGLAVKVATTGLTGWVVAMGAAFLAANALVTVIDTWLDSVNRINAAKARALKTEKGLIENLEEEKEKVWDLWRAEKITMTERMNRTAKIDSAIAKLRERAKKKRIENAEETAEVEKETIEEVKDVEIAAIEKVVEIREASLQDRLNGLVDHVDAVDSVFSNFIDLQITGIHKIRDADISSAENAYDARKEWIEENIDDEDERATKLGTLEEGFQATIENIKDKAERAEEERRKKLKPLMIAKAIADTAAAVVEALPNPFLAAAVGIAGALEVATIRGQEFHQGGITTAPTSGILNANEAVIPLESPTARRMLGGSGIGGRTINIHGNTFVGTGGMEELKDMLSNLILNDVQREVLV